MAVDSAPEHLVQTCAAYQRDVALMHLDTPPGDAREARLAEAMARVAEACTPAAIEALHSQLTVAPASHQEALRRLRGWALAMHVQHALLPVQREIQTRQRTTVCLVDEEPIPLRASFAAMATETRRDRRAAIEAAVCLQLGDLNELFEAQFTGLTSLTEHLGYASPEAFWADALPVEPAAHQDIATHILESTREVYVDLLTWAVRRRLRLPPGQLRRHDILALVYLPRISVVLSAWHGGAGPANVSPRVWGLIPTPMVAWHGVNGRHTLVRQQPWPCTFRTKLS